MLKANALGACPLPDLANIAVIEFPAPTRGPKLSATTLQADAQDFVGVTPIKVLGLR